MDPLQSILLNPKYHDILAILKGFRNGLVYGAKIRAPHAAVMVFLFRNGTTRQKLTAVFNATKQHAKNLAKYVTIYKTALLVLRNLHSGNSRPIDSFLSGLLGGYVVFGENNNINQQIVLYVFARVAMGSAKVLASGKFSDGPFDQLIGSQRMKDIAWPLFASLCWGAVMYLHSEHVQAIQPSLASSMNYLYNDSNNWNSFRNFFWHNI